MKFPYFQSRKKIESLSKKDEKVFAEASELAQLRLEQSIADLRICIPPRNATPGASELRPLRKFTDAS